jgi:hypothetical protein
MRRRMIRTLAGVVLLLAGSGCGGSAPLQIADASIPPAGRSYKSLGWTSAESCQERLFGFAITDGGRTYDAYKAALAAKPGADALIDVTTDTHLRVIVVWQRICVELHGEAIQFSAS